MALLVKKISTGNAVVFDRETKVMFLIDPEYVNTWEKAETQSITFAHQMAERGEALYFDRKTLELVGLGLLSVSLLQ